MKTVLAIMLFIAMCLLFILVIFAVSFGIFDLYLLMRDSYLTLKKEKEWEDKHGC